MHMTLSSRGRRKTSRTWRRNSGSSSRNSPPLWASETSPGVGIWPPTNHAHVGDGLMGGGLKLLFTPPHSPRYNWAHALEVCRSRLL
jgi:hypothetical protein